MARGTARGMARIAPASGGTGRIAATAVMHQHRDGHELRHDVAAVLALEGQLILAALGIGGLLFRLGFRQHQGVSATFRAGRKTQELGSVLLYHNRMAVGTAVGRKLQGTRIAFSQMVFRQAERAVFPHRCMALGTLATLAGLQSFLVQTVIHPTQPRGHPHRDFVGRMVVGGLVNRLRIDGSLGQLVGRLQDAVVVAVANPSEIQKQRADGRPIEQPLFVVIGTN